MVEKNVMNVYDTGISYPNFGVLDLEISNSVCFANPLVDPEINFNTYKSVEDYNFLPKNYLINSVILASERKYLTKLLGIENKHLFTFQNGSTYNGLIYQSLKQYRDLNNRSFMKKLFYPRKEELKNLKHDVDAFQIFVDNVKSAKFNYVKSVIAEKIVSENTRLHEGEMTLFMGSQFDHDIRQAYGLNDKKWGEK